MNSAIGGVVYLLHFHRKIGNPDNPHGQAQHYIGWAYRLSSRIDQHLKGRGSALTRAAVAQGIPFETAAIWPGDRNYERKLKNRKNAARMCPICRRERMKDQLPLDFSDDVW